MGIGSISSISARPRRCGIDDCGCSWRSTLYNALNSSAVLSHNLAFVPGGTWPQPLTIMTPRLIKITSEVDF